MVFDEHPGVAEFAQKLADRQVVGDAPGLRLGLAEEAEDVADELPVLGANDVAALAEEAVEMLAAILHPAGLDRYGKAHRRWRGLDAEVRKQRAEVAVILLVENDEASIDRYRSLRHVGDQGVGVTADTPALFEERYV